MMQFPGDFIKILYDSLHFNEFIPGDESTSFVCKSQRSADTEKQSQSICVVNVVYRYFQFMKLHHKIQWQFEAFTDHSNNSHSLFTPGETFTAKDVIQNVKFEHISVVVLSRKFRRWVSLWLALFSIVITPIAKKTFPRVEKKSFVI